MTVLRSREIPSASDESPPKKPRRSAEIDGPTPARDEVVGTPPSPSLLPSPDSGGTRSGAPLRRSLRLASAEGSGGATEGTPPPKGSSPCKDEGEGGCLSTPADEKAEAGKWGPGAGGSGRKGRGKRKPEVDAALIVSPGRMSLRSGKSVATRSGDSGAAHDFADNAANVIDLGGNKGIVISEVSGVASDDMKNRGKRSPCDEIDSSRSRTILKTGDKGKGKINENEVIDLDTEATGSEGVRVREECNAEEKGKGVLSCDSNLPSDGIGVIDLNLALEQPVEGMENFDMESENMAIVPARRERARAAGEASESMAIVPARSERTRAAGEASENVAIVPARSERARAAGEAGAADMRGRFRDIARRNASRFAHFNPDNEDGNDLPVEAAINVNVALRPADPVPEDWPGPFSTAMKIIRDRVGKVSAPQSSSCPSKYKSAFTWVPNRDMLTRTKRDVPSLIDLCLKVLAANADAIPSLIGVPDMYKHKLSQLLCDSRKMNKHFFDLLVGGSPTEIRIPDSSWLSEEELAESFGQCDTSNLTVLQLDQCGRCLPDYVISSSICQSANSLPALSTISITGACRLTDGGLARLVSSAPKLESINLSQCSLLTARSIETLANSLGLVLRELYMNDCQGIDAMLILPALKKLKHLQVLSVAGMSSVSDDFVREVVLQDHNIKELVLRDCTNLTDASLKAVAATCPGLLSLNLVNLTKLTDSSVGCLANSCQAIKKLILSRNAFSDEAVAAFLETSGELLEELSLNNVKKVGPNTAISLAKQARKLQSLDLSWCRGMTDEALGLIVDSCLCLKELRVFGCTQITDTFLKGHMNEDVKIVGLKMTPILENRRVLIPQCPLKYS